jgi:hypothetical protein
MKKENTHVLWHIISQSYIYFDKGIKEGISRSSQQSPVLRGPPDSEDTTLSSLQLS